MKAKRSKYDTNPLDEKVADHAEDSWGSSPPDASTGGVSGATREIPGPQRRTVQGDSESEAPTPRIDEKAVTSYPSVFIPPAHPKSSIYQPPRVPPPLGYQPPPLP